MKDRLRERERSGGDRCYAEVVGATAVSCRAASGYEPWASPCPVSTSVAQLEEPRYMQPSLKSATAVAHGCPGAVRPVDMQDTSGTLRQAASCNTL